MNKQEINNLKEEFDKLTSMISNAKSVTEDLEKKADKIKKQLEDAEKKATDGKLREYKEGNTRGYYVRTTPNELERLKVHFELKKYVYEHDPRPITKDDWKGRNLNNLIKYTLYYGYIKNEVSIQSTWSCKNILDIYASDPKILEDAIKAIGEDRIKKYLFEVE